MLTANLSSPLLDKENQIVHNEYSFIGFIDSFLHTLRLYLLNFLVDDDDRRNMFVSFQFDYNI